MHDGLDQAEPVVGGNGVPMSTNTNGSDSPLAQAMEGSLRGDRVDEFHYSISSVDLTSPTSMTDQKESFYLTLPINQLVKRLSSDAQIGSSLQDEIRGALIVAVARVVTESIDRHERAATKLSNRLLWLNVILGAFTIVGTVLAVIPFLPK